MSGNGRDARFAEARRLIEEARRAGLPLVVADDDLRCGSNIDAASEPLKARLRTLREDVIAELSRPNFRMGDRSSAPVRLPEYWLVWWSEMKVNPLLPNLHVAWRLRGGCCADRFRRAIASVIARHPLLKAGIGDHGNFLEIEFGEECALNHATVTEQSSIGCHSGTADRAQALAEEMVWAPLRNGRIFRPFLVEISPTEVLCGFVLHHLVADFHACQLIAGQILRQVEFASDAVPEERWLEYSEYVRAISQWEDGPGGQYRLAYWKSHLAGFPAVRLPGGAGADRVTPWRTVEFAIDEELRTRLAQVAESSATTLAQVLLAAKFVTLAAMLRQTDLVVTIIVSGRDYPQLLKFIGNVADLLPIRIDVGQSRSFRSLLERLRSSYVLGYRYRIKWELILKALVATGADVVAPTFNFVSAGRPEPAQQGDGAQRTGVSIEVIEVQRPPDQGSATWYTSHEMNLFDTGLRIGGNVKYMPARQRTSVVEEFVQRFLRCLERIAESPLTHVSELMKPPTA